MPRLIEAAAGAVHDYLPHFIAKPTKEDEAIARCAILQMIAPQKTDDDFLNVVFAHRCHRRAAKKFLTCVGGDGLLVLTGATLEALNGQV